MVGLIHDAHELQFMQIDCLPETLGGAIEQKSVAAVIENQIEAEFEDSSRVPVDLFLDVVTVEICSICLKYARIMSQSDSKQLYSLI